MSKVPLYAELRALSGINNTKTTMKPLVEGVTHLTATLSSLPPKCESWDKCFGSPGMWPAVGNQFFKLEVRALLKIEGMHRP